MSTVTTEHDARRPPLAARAAWRCGSASSSLLIAVGFGVWIYQLSQGLQITNMRDNVIWGLYIITFMFFVGLSAGGLIVASAGRLFDVERFTPIVRLAVVEADGDDRHRGAAHHPRPRPSAAHLQPVHPRPLAVADDLGRHGHPHLPRALAASTCGSTRGATWPRAAAGWRSARRTRATRLALTTTT